MSVPLSLTITLSILSVIGGAQLAARVASANAAADPRYTVPADLRLPWPCGVELEVTTTPQGHWGEDGYGARSLHGVAWDFAGAPEDMQIVAPGDGSATPGSDGPTSGRGNYSAVALGNGWTFYAAHLAQPSTTSGGVHRGQVLGTIGTTGYSSGIHLHAELQLDGDRPDLAQMPTIFGVPADALTLGSRIKSNNCDEAPEPPRPDPAVHVAGQCTSAGGEVAVTASNLEPGADYGLGVWRDEPEPNFELYAEAPDRLVADASGVIVWNWSCKDAPPGAYTVGIQHSDERMTWGDFEVAAPLAPQRPVTKPKPATTTTAPTKAKSPARPLATTRPAPKVVALRIYNKVTNGATEMREDTPTYLSTVTKNYCRRDGCMVAGTEMNTGATVTGLCWVIGDRTTNGEDGNSRDDGNPGLFESTRWYRARHANGSVGLISEVWIDPAQRGGAGLPQCS